MQQYWWLEIISAAANNISQWPLLFRLATLLHNDSLTLLLHPHNSNMKRRCDDEVRWLHKWPWLACKGHQPRSKEHCRVVVAFSLCQTAKSHLCWVRSPHWALYSLSSRSITPSLNPKSAMFWIEPWIWPPFSFEGSTSKSSPLMNRHATSRRRRASMFLHFLASPSSCNPSKCLQDATDIVRSSWTITHVVRSACVAASTVTTRSARSSVCALGENWSIFY